MRQRVESWWAGRETACGKCACIFALEPSDEVTKYARGPEYLFQVSCPKCGSPVILTRPDWK